MPAIKSNPHLTVYDITRMLRAAGFSPYTVTAFDGEIEGFECWREGRGERKKYGVLRLRARGYTYQAGRKSAERAYVEALRAAGLWVRVVGANIIIPQEDKYLAGSYDERTYTKRVKKGGTD